MEKDTKIKMVDPAIEKINIKISWVLGRVGQLVKVLSQYTKFLGSISWGSGNIQDSPNECINK